MPAMKVPKYRRQKVKDHVYAFVDLNGERRYLGEYNTPESQEAYNRLIAEWLETGRSKIIPPASTDVQPQLTVLELCAEFWSHVEKYYRRPDGSATSEQENYRQVMRPLKELYASTKVSEFGPRALKAVRQKLCERKMNRITINKHTSRIKSLFKWGVEQEIVPPNVWHGLQAVAGLRRGRTDAKEPEPVRPVLQAYIDAVQPYVSRQVWAIIQLQLFTAARCGELVTMRATEIDTSGPIWIYKPTEHKTAHHGIERNIYIGPRAQEVIAPFMVSRPISACLFSAIEADKERYAKAGSHRRRDQKPNPRITP